jgi:hypothetical protein
MIERGMSSQVSGESEVELKCFRVIEKEIPLLGCPTLPFIGQGKDLGYTREKNREGDSPEAVLPFSSAGRSCVSCG